MVDTLRTQEEAIGDVKTDLRRIGKEILGWIFNLVKRLVAGTLDFGNEFLGFRKICGNSCPAIGPGF